MIHRAKVNQDLCIGCGQCEESCAEVFRITQKVTAVAVESDTGYAVKDHKIVKAYRGCPVMAIEIDSDDATVEMVWHTAEVHEKQMLSESVMMIRLKTIEQQVKPGQYVTVRFKDDVGYFNRAYSVLDWVDGMLTLCVSLVQGGRGSSVLAGYDIGTRVELTEPKGEFLLKSELGDKIFVATGAGLVPLIPMMEQCPQARKVLYFGHRKQTDLFLMDRLEKIPNLDIRVCLSREGEGWAGLRGHVTDHLSEAEVSSSAEVYLCGSDAMMQETEAILQRRKHPAKQCFKESFSGVAATTVTEPSGVRLRAWTRNIHIYTTLAMAMLFFFFGVTGFMASRPELFPTEVVASVPAHVEMKEAELSGFFKGRLSGAVALREFESEEGYLTLVFENEELDRFSVELDAEERLYTVTTSHAIPDMGAELEPEEVARNLAERHPGKLDGDSVDAYDSEIVFSLESVWGNRMVEVDLTAGRYRLSSDPVPFVSGLIQLHRGKLSGPGQRLLLDLTALIMVVATVTGVMMGAQSRNPTMRITTWVSVAVSLILMILMVVGR